MIRKPAVTQDVSAQSGFTLVELVVAMVFTMMFAAMVFGFMLNFWSATATLEHDSETFVTREDAGDSLRDALNAGSHLITQNSITDANATIPDPSDATKTHWLLIHAIPGSTAMPAGGSYKSVFYYDAPSVDSSKNVIYNGSLPYYDEFVLYMNGTTKQLLLRKLANTSATGNNLKTTCPAAIATTTCPADTIIADDVSSVDTRYFSRSGNTIDYTSITDPTTGNYIGPDFPAVEVVEITLHLSHSSTIHGGATTLNEAIVRVALRNE